MKKRRVSCLFFMCLQYSSKVQRASQQYLRRRWKPD